METNKEVQPNRLGCACWRHRSPPAETICSRQAENWAAAAWV